MVSRSVMTLSGVISMPDPGASALPPTNRPTRSPWKAGVLAMKRAKRRAWSMAKAFIG
jgi:hypothetical protein